jgi:hypothetical protein
MTRRHPQTANAPEAKPVTFCYTPTLTGKYAIVYLNGEKIAECEVSFAKYGAGVPPGEPIRLTAAQLAEWRKQ